MKPVLKKRFLLIFLSIPMLVFFYNNCSQRTDGTTTTPSLQSGTCGENLPAILKSPQSIDQVMQLISALPKPLDLDCFILSLKRPLQIFAVDSTASVQPSVGANNPRIFIISGKLVMAVVPKGPGSRLLELSEKVSTTASVKGELAFPVSTNSTADAPYSHILQAGGGTSCRVCHTNEARNLNITTGEAFNSNILVPDSSKRITSSYLRSQSILCDPSIEAYRCKMLRALMIDGQGQDGVFP